jgi:hypothetical protein
MPLPSGYKWMLQAHRLCLYAALLMPGFAQVAQGGRPAQGERAMQRRRSLQYWRARQR